MRRNFVISKSELLMAENWFFLVELQDPEAHKLSEACRNAYVKGTLDVEFVKTENALAGFLPEYILVAIPKEYPGRQALDSHYVYMIPPKEDMHLIEALYKGNYKYVKAFKVGTWLDPWVSQMRLRNPKGNLTTNQKLRRLFKISGCKNGEEFAALVGLPYDSFLAYSCGRRNIPRHRLWKAVRALRQSRG